MFPHNSSSHEISTETNAFVQNSKGDVVVLEGSSLSGVGEGKGPEDAGYCDIEFINSSSSTMAAPTSHPEATAANDFSTVLSRHSGELGSAVVRSSPTQSAAAEESTPSPATATLASLASCHSITISNSNNNNNNAKNNKMNNDKKQQHQHEKRSQSRVGVIMNQQHLNNAEHNHHHHKLAVAALSQQQQRDGRPASQEAANSKSTCKPLSDNKDSFSIVSPRVLSLMLISWEKDATTTTKMMMMIMMGGAGASLVRIPKSEGGHQLAAVVAANLKAKLSHVSYFKPNNSESVISLSSSVSSGGASLWASSSITLNVVAGQLVTPTTTKTTKKMKKKNQKKSSSGAVARASAEQTRLCVPLVEAKSPRRIIDGISCTEATMCTVGALSLQDNNKSNEPLNASFKSSQEQAIIHKLKSLSKSTPSDKNKSDNNNNNSSSIARANDRDKSDNIPTLNDDDDNNQIIVPATSSSLVRDLVQDCKRLLAEYLARPSEDSLLGRLRESLDALASCRLIADYKRRWGIAPHLRGLLGGGESSLNSSATANWAQAQPTTPNNNNQAQSGWGTPGAGNNGTGAAGTGGNGTPGNPQVQGQAGPPPGNWQNVPGARTLGNQNPNQGQGPPGPQNNQGSNVQAGPPTSQPNNQSQPNQGSNGGAGTGGQWGQNTGKPTNAPGPNGGQGQNNNGQNVSPQQQQQQQSPQQQPGQQPQQPNQQQPGGGANNNQPGQGGPASTATTPTTSNPSTKQQLEQLNTMREALFSPDGWGCQHVNQDTNWDVPTSPEPSMNKDAPMWKPPVNNGTDLWEANLRNGGQPPPPQQAKAPWGHTPSTNIGGTWGEDDDSADTSNMWTGAPAPSQPNTAPWPGANSANQTAGSNWGDPRVDPRDPREIRSVDPREMRGAIPRDHRMSLDPREQHMRVIDPMSRDPRMSGEIRGDPRGGISGRLNGAGADAMWNQPPGPPHHQIPGHQGHPSGPPTKMLTPPSMNQWSAQPPKDMMQGGKPSGWEEPSPPTQRRNMPNYDDGTSLWGNPAANQRPMQSAKVSHWKDSPAQNVGRGGMQCPPGMLQNQMPGGQPDMKPDPVGGGGNSGGGPMWNAHPGVGSGHNGSWGDGPSGGGGGGGGPADWASESKPRNRPRYGPELIDPRTGKPLGWEEHQKPPSMGGGPGSNWGDTDMDTAPTSHWGHKMLTKELIWNSREFRYLCDMGFKKEDVETALRSRDMNRDEAQEMLSQVRPVDQWRRHDTGHSGYDPSSQSGGGQSFSRFNHVSQQMSFPPQASRTPQNPPSTQQLRMLVQQIQLAVQEGYLNHQILNQPLAPQTLILLNQLLQQIKVLQQLHQQHTMQNSLKGNSQTVLQISVQITKTKQQIANLQNQIAVQQATYMKQQAQQQQQQPHPSSSSQPSDYYKPSVHDPMSALQNSFSDLAMNKEPPVSQQQSRLNQWKLPSLDKDADSEFSRAPGSTSNKPPTTPGGLSQSHSSPNMNPLLGPSDATWSSRLGDSGWPDAGNADSTDGKDWQPPGAGAAFSDLVPEFEPGKPWKMKTIEDDPSLTPGSVVRSPLSLAAIKDSDTIFSTGTKTSPPPQNADTSSIPSLSNSTWSFNPPATTPSVFTSSKNTWGDTAPPPTAVTSELWGAPMGKSRGPPPGLGNKSAGSVSNAASNGWTALGRSNTWGLQSNAPTGGNSGWVSPSTWLLLRNLTPQIDGSTLKTLCMQHGPVQDFRLYLNHGIALAKYSSRDEAIKAQGALNNCVLGNTTIFAESPVDSEVHTLLQQLGHGSGGAAAGAGAPGQNPSGGAASWNLRAAAAPTAKVSAGDTWGAGASQLWGAPPSSNSLWSSSLDTSEQQRATPSSLNSYLPGDLLGGESM